MSVWASSVHVTPYGHVWAIRTADDPRPLAIHNTCEQAVADARALAGAHSVDLVVFDRTGREVYRVRASAA